MQNVVNLKCPFFGRDGKPIAAGRVHFVKPDTTASDFNGLSELDYIVIKDKNNHTLSNPLDLDSLGQFTTQPFVSDNINYKMYVDARTGIPADFEDDSPEWETQLIIDSKKFVAEVLYSGIPQVATISALRTLDPSIGKVVVIGYYEAGDCPARVFNYVQSSVSENYGTQIKSSVSGANGCWVMTPCDVLDVRWFGIKTTYSTKTDISQRLNNTSSVGKAVYFPAGTYYVGSSVSIPSMVLDKNANIYPYSTTSVELTIGHIENRGGYFCATTSAKTSARVIPCLTGSACTSWLNGDVHGFLTTNFMSGLDEIIFDSFSEDSSPNAVQIENKRIVVYSQTPSNMTFVGCIIAGPNKTEVIEEDDRTSIYAGVIEVCDGDKQTTISKNIVTRNIECNSLYAQTADARTIGADAIYSPVVNVSSDTSQEKTTINLGSIEVITEDAEGNLKQTTIGRDIVTSNVECRGLDNQKETFLRDYVEVSGPALFEQRFGYRATLQPSSGTQEELSPVLFRKSVLLLRVNITYSVDGYMLSLGTETRVSGRRVVIFTNKDLYVFRSSDEWVESNFHVLAFVPKYCRNAFVCKTQDDGTLNWEVDPFYI